MNLAASVVRVSTDDEFDDVQGQMIVDYIEERLENFGNALAVDLAFQFGMMFRVATSL